MKKLVKIISLVKEFGSRVERDSIGAYSAQSALFIIISFFPFCMLALTLVNYLPFSVDELQDFSINILSPKVSEFVNSVVSEIFLKASAAVISVTSVTALWSSSRAILSISGGLNRVYGAKEKRGYIKLRLISVFYTLVMVVILIIIIAVLIFGGTISRWISGVLPDFIVVTDFFFKIRWVLGFLILILFFMFIYTIVPERKTKFRNELPGAVISAIGWILFSAIYSAYVENSSNYSYLYGSLTMIVFLILWLYFCMFIMFIGAEINDFFGEEENRLKLKAIFRKE